MFRLSKKARYAVEAVLDIAYHAGAEPVQSLEITRRQGIPKRYLEQALQRLVREGILAGVRGPRGGYRLARERRRISVGDIARVMISDEKNNKQDVTFSSSDLGRKVVQRLWKNLEEEMMVHLENTTIDDLCDAAEQESIESEGRGTIDYSI